MIFLPALGPETPHIDLDLVRTGFINSLLVSPYSSTDRHRGKPCFLHAVFHAASTVTHFHHNQLPSCLAPAFTDLFTSCTIMSFFHAFDVSFIDFSLHLLSHTFMMDSSASSHDSQHRHRRRRDRGLILRPGPGDFPQSHPTTPDSSTPISRPTTPPQALQQPTNPPAQPPPSCL